MGRQRLACTHSHQYPLSVTRRRRRLQVAETGELFTAGGDNCARSWDIATSKELKVYTAKDWVSSMYTTSFGEARLAGAWSRLWQ